MVTRMVVCPALMVSPLLQYRLVDLLPVEQGAVGAAEVADAAVVGRQFDLEVPA